MAKEFELSRRENALTIRFLAQCLVNDIVFPNQKGISDLIRQAFNKRQNQSFIDDGPQWEYWFLFHLEDFGSNDKSEIDLLLRKGNYIFPVEIKAFTNPNAADVKREIVRNYLNLSHLSQNHQKSNFNIIESIIPILLYSKPVHLKYNPSGCDFDYFNKNFLIKKGERQKEDLLQWNTKKFRFEDKDTAIYEKAKEISMKLLFLNWDDVYKVLNDNNFMGSFNKIIAEIKRKRDFINDVYLVSDQIELPCPP